MATHYTIMTDVGAAKVANAYRLNTSLSITHLAVGDGGGALPQPNSSDKALVNEKHRAPINLSYIDKTNNAWVVFEQVLAPDVGGWWIREVGLYDADGDLIAIGNYPEQYKPLLDEGASTTQTVRVIIQVLSSSAITLKVDPSVVLATRDYVDDKFADHEESRNHPAGTEAAQGMLKLSPVAETVKGTNASNATHPAGVKAAVDASVKTHTDASTAHKASQIALETALATFGSAATVQAVLELLDRGAKLPTATSEQAAAMATDEALLTPFSLTALFSGNNQMLTPRGFQRLPGGLFLQWIDITVSGTLRTQTVGSASLVIFDEGITASWPFKFPNACLFAGGGFSDIAQGFIENMTISGAQTNAYVRANGLGSRPAGETYSINGKVFGIGF